MRGKVISATVAALLIASPILAGPAEDCNQTEDAELGIRGCTELIRRNPRNAEAYDNRGSHYNTKGDRKQALADHSKAIAINPKDSVAYYNRGIAYSDMKDWDRAVADYSKAIALNPRDAGAYYNRGNVRVEKQQFDGAIADYTASINIKPSYEAISNRGSEYARKGDVARAIADFNRLLEVEPDEKDRAYLLLGFVYYAKGDFDEAAKQMSRTQLSHPSGRHAALFRYLARWRANDEKAARGDLEALLPKIDDSWPTPAMKLLVGRGTIDEVRKAAGHDDACDAHFFIGMSHVIAGNSTAAIPELRKVRDACPLPQAAAQAIAIAELKRIAP